MTDLKNIRRVMPTIIADDIIGVAPMMAPQPGAIKEYLHSFGSIYMASKAKYGARWIALRDAGWNINSSWIDVWDADQIDDWAAHWVKCIEQAAAADYCIAYCEPDDTLKGALCEVGASLAGGKQVLYVGDPVPKRYSVANHPNVTVFQTVDEALKHIKSKWNLS